MAREDRSGPVDTGDIEDLRGCRCRDRSGRVFVLQRLRLVSSWLRDGDKYVVEASGPAVRADGSIGTQVRQAEIALADVPQANLSDLIAREQDQRARVLASHDEKIEALQAALDAKESK